MQQKPLLLNRWNSSWFKVFFFFKAQCYRKFPPLFTHLVPKTGLTVIISPVCALCCLCIYHLVHIWWEWLVLSFCLFAQSQNTHTVLSGDYAARLSLVRTKCCIVSNVLGQLRKVWIDMMCLASLYCSNAHSLVSVSCESAGGESLRRCGNKHVWNFGSLRNGQMNRFKCALSGAERL